MYMLDAAIKEELTGRLVELEKHFDSDVGFFMAL